MGAQILVKQQALDVQPKLCISYGGAQLLDRDAVFCAQGVQHMGFDQVIKRQQRRLFRGRMNQRLKLLDAAGFGIETTDDPRPERGAREFKVARSLRQRVGRLISEIDVFCVRHGALSKLPGILNWNTSLCSRHPDLRLIFRNI